MSRRTWSALFRSMFGSFSAKAKVAARRPNLALERMEDRAVPAAFTYSGTDLTIDLDNANESITLTAQGGGNYVFTSTNNFTGTDITGLTGNNTNTLTIANTLSLTNAFITDSATGTSVVFGTSTGSYVDNFTIQLDNSAGNISFTGSTTFDDASNNNLVAKTTGATGAVTQTAGTLAVGGSSTFQAATTITLTQTTNDFTGAVSLQNFGANNVSITDINAIILGTSSVGTGTFTINAVGITQSGAITQATGAGAASFTANAGVITLTQSNDFTGAVTATGAATQITDTNALTVSLTTTGSTVLSAGGNLVASGTVTGATSDLTTTTTGTGTTSFGATTVGQNLSVTSVGAVSQTGALTVTGTASFAAGTSNITLDTASNAFSTVTVTSGANVSLAETGGFTIGG
ncbi:MAG: beta strand repeat-containing protein, partial [Planctomycetota bacterium]